MYSKYLLWLIEWDIRRAFFHCWLTIIKQCTEFPSKFLYYEKPQTLFSEHEVLCKPRERACEVFLCRSGTGTCHKQTSREANLVRLSFESCSCLHLWSTHLILDEVWWFPGYSLTVLNEMCSEISDSYWLDKEWKIRREEVNDRIRMYRRKTKAGHLG